MNKHNLGPMLAALRYKTGLTQRELADKLKYDTSQIISNYENGVSFPPPKALRLLCRLSKTDYHVTAAAVTEEIIERHTKTIINKYGL